MAIFKNFELTDNRQVFTARFVSISDFINWLNVTPVNEVYSFQASHGFLSSHLDTDQKVRHSHTKNYDEAMDLLAHGWAEGAQRINKKILKMNRNDMGELTKIAREVGVVGFQPIVPLAMMGVPNAMINIKRSPKKDKVLNLVHSCCYSANIEAAEIEDQTVRTLQLVKMLEDSGYRVNLETCFYSSHSNRTIGFSVKIKSANERLNVSKMAFCLGHPSFLRRFAFAFVEHFPHTTQGFEFSYGKVTDNETVKKIITATHENKSLFVPSYIGNVNGLKVSNIGELEEWLK